MTDTLEQKGGLRPGKKFMRGVYYDRRIRKFTAEIRIAGKRIYLGAFETEDDAAAAHALARHDNPIRRGGADGGESFVEAYDAFLQDEAEHTGQPKGVLQAGVEFTAPSGQCYFLAKVDTVLKPGHERVKWVYYRWYSKCSECGTDFVTSTMPSKRNNGMTRTCWQHRKKGPRADEPGAHMAVLKEVRVAQAGNKAKEEDEKEAVQIMLRYSQQPGATRAGNKKAYNDAVAMIAARRAAAKNDTEGLV